MKKKTLAVSGLILSAVLLCSCGSSNDNASAGEQIPKFTETQAAAETQTAADTQAPETQAASETQVPETQTAAETQTAETQTAVETQATETQTITETQTAVEAQANAAAALPSGNITQDEAKAIALSDAGVQESDVTGIRVRSEMDDGIEEYEIDFYVGNTEYDYDIDAATGKIRSKDMDIDDDFGGQVSSEASISEEDAIAIVLQELPEAQADDVRIKQDWDDGKLIYEGSVYLNGRRQEYEFEIDTSTGNILSWEEED